jgi:hypothetical protein
MQDQDDGAEPIASHSPPTPAADTLSDHDEVTPELCFRRGLGGKAMQVGLGR